MRQAPVPCLEINCSGYASQGGRGRCETHKRPAFYGSTRAERLPKNWNILRNTVFARDKGICQVCYQATATEVDHIVAGDDHRLTNLQAICTQCHKKKTNEDANKAKQELKARRENWKPEPFPF